MAIREWKPVTPGQRGKVLLDSKDLTRRHPEKTLLEGKKRISGRDGQGHITVRRRGGGAKRRYRRIDFLRNKRDTEGRIKTIEYDPNRSAYIALVTYVDGEKRYILCPDGLRVGDKIVSGHHATPEVGNALPLERINVGTFIHNIELTLGKGGQLARSAGVFAKILGRDGKYCSIQFPSGEVRQILGKCYATVGVVGNKNHKNIMSGKAGRSRWLNRRPKVRGVAMNPVDHPMGGGEGRTSGGRHPVSPTGVPAKGFKTRRANKYSDHFILRKRKTKRR